MVKYISLFLTFVIFPCSTNGNEYNHLRLNSKRFSIKPNENLDLFNYIDTSSFYKLLLNKNLIKSRKNRSINIEMVEGIKFYPDGKVGYFKDVDFKDINTLDPKKSIMGYYNFSKNKVKVEFIVDFPQAGKQIWREEIILTKDDFNDTLTPFVKKVEDSVMYKKIKIPDKKLINQPD